MVCPQCGYDMGTQHKCMRCGYEVKTLVSVSEEEQKKRQEEETIVIDPNSTILTDEYGNAVDEDDDDMYYVDPISAIFDGLFGDPFADLFGGLFGMDTQPHRSSHRVVKEQPKEKDPNVVEVKKVEFLDEDGKPIKQESKIKKTVNKAGEKIRQTASNVKKKFKRDNNKQ